MRFSFFAIPSILHASSSPSICVFYQQQVSKSSEQSENEAKIIGTQCDCKVPQFLRDVAQLHESKEKRSISADLESLAVKTQDTACVKFAQNLARWHAAVHPKPEAIAPDDDDNLAESTESLKCVHAITALVTAEKTVTMYKGHIEKGCDCNDPKSLEALAQLSADKDKSSILDNWVSLVNSLQDTACQRFAKTLAINSVGHPIFGW
jgi:hypothetical protein